MQAVRDSGWCQANLVLDRAPTQFCLRLTGTEVRVGLVSFKKIVQEPAEDLTLKVENREGTFNQVHCHVRALIEGKVLGQRVFDIGFSWRLLINGDEVAPKTR